MKLKFVTAFLSVLVVVSFSSILLSKKEPNIFNPQMKPTAGDWGNPAHRVGEKPKKTWSKTTIGAGVNKQPLQGKVVTRVGEIIDVSCYNQLGKHGKPHAGCGKACILNGAPMGLLEASGTVYLLMPEEHDARRDGKTALRETLIHHVGQVVELTGTYTNINGTKAIFVHGFVKNQ